MDTEAGTEHTSKLVRKLKSTCSDLQQKIWRRSFTVLLSVEQTLNSYHIEGTELDSVFKITMIALAGVAKWIERQPLNQRVTSSLPSQGTCLSCRPCIQ